MDDNFVATRDEYMDPYEEQEIRNNLIKMAKVGSKMQGEYAQQQHDEFMSETWAAVLKESGLTPEAYAELASRNPEMTKSLIKQGMRHITEGIRGSSGKGKPQAGQPKWDRFYGDLPHKPQPNEQRMKDIQTARQEGRLDSEDALNKMCEELLPASDPIWRKG